MKKVLFVLVLFIVLCIGSAVKAAPVDESIVVPPDAKCGQWWQLMNDQGWSDADIAKADRIMFRESKCMEEMHNKLDPTTINGVKGSLGLFQINLFWLSKTVAYPQGFLQTMLKRELKPKDLFDPLTNIQAARAIIRYNRANGGCGWDAWKAC